MNEITCRVTKMEDGLYRLTWNNDRTRNNQGYYRIITMDQVRQIADQASRYSVRATVCCHSGYTEGFRKRKDAVSLAEFIRRAYRDGAMEEPTRKRRSQGGA